MTTDTATITIKLHDLEICQDNIRQTHSTDGIEELAASIRNHGLFNPLLVKADDDTKVIAGGRRLAALKLLRDQGHIGDDYEVLCRIAREDVEGSELSLAENVVREAMHPLDQASAFSRLVKKKIRIDDIAVRFGVTPTVVHKRLALNDLSPKIAEAFRNSKITLAHAQAFTMVSDHEAQDSVFENFDPEYEDAQDIRDGLADDGFVRGDNKCAVFVGLEAYGAAGGTVSRDLFTQSLRGAYLHDKALLDRLAEEKLADAAQAVQQEGWSWVEHTLNRNFSKYMDHSNSEPTVRDLDTGEQKTRDDLQAKLDALNEQYDQAPPRSDEAQAIEEQVAIIEAQIEAIDEACKSWSDRQKSGAGAVLWIDSEGRLKIERGLIRPKVTKVAAQKQKDKADSAGGGDNDGASTIPDTVQLPAKLVRTLSAHKSAAIGAKIAKNPDKALALVAFKFIAAVISLSRIDVIGAASISLDETLYKNAGLDEAGVCKGLDQLVALQDELMAALPGEGKRPTTEELLSWCMEQDHDTLTRYIALCVGLSVDTISDNIHAGRYDGHQLLVEHFAVDMNEYFVPDAENFFDNLSTLQILAVMHQAGVEIKDEWKKLKKKDLALLAEGEIHTVNPLWLPPVLAPMDAISEDDGHPDEDEDEDEDDDNDTETGDADDEE